MGFHYLIFSLNFRVTCHYPPTNCYWKYKSSETGGRERNLTKEMDTRQQNTLKEGEKQKKKKKKKEMKEEEEEEEEEVLRATNCCVVHWSMWKLETSVASALFFNRPPSSTCSLTLKEDNNKKQSSNKKKNSREREREKMIEISIQI